MDFIFQPWPWYVAGPLLAVVMFSLLFFGKNFGMSANLRTMCSMSGGGKFSDFFRFDWKKQSWNLIFVVGTIGGGFIASHFLTTSEAVALSSSTIESLQEIGFSNPGGSYLPDEIFSMESMMSVQGLLLLIGAGFLVGFGARYAGGCTSGHAISGISDLQIPSIIAVIGFFIGGLIMTHLLIPVLF